MKCEVCEKSAPYLYESGALSVCVKCNAKLCEYCAETTEHRRIPIENVAGYVAMVCPVCTLEAAFRVINVSDTLFDADGLDGFALLNLAINSLKGE
jgi:hypothetical protein